MTSTPLETCPGCLVQLPAVGGPTHRYIGASGACWDLFAALSNGGSPPLAPGPLNGLLVDAYAAQHPGVPSNQSIQSVAVHVLVLYGILDKELSPELALTIRLKAVSDRAPKHGRYRWLTPPDFTGSITVADVAAQPTPAARTTLVNRYIHEVWSRWSAGHRDTIAAWFDEHVGVC
ncbi:MAG: hypothetical protein KC441_14105 [Anaerolineales bacterium]|nr:hypothetical protein [Anaerolineales bacterium]